MEFGNYPTGYDPVQHGPYDPSQFYGKQDTAFGDVKIGELDAWFRRRNKSLPAFAGVFSRAYWRWQHKYVQPKRCGMAAFFQFVSAGMVFFYLINYGKLKRHRNYKYH